MRKLLICATLLSCGKPIPVNSNTAVINGVSTSDYPAVVQILSEYPGNRGGMCTGTFIRDDLLITAAHCVDGAKSVVANGKRSLEVYYNEYYKEDSPYWVSYDQALVKFPRNTSRHVMALATTAIKNHDTLTLVGFGINDYVYDYARREWQPSRIAKSGVKRMGKNTYFKNDELADQGIIQFVGKAQTENSGVAASLGQGDSGGPLIVDNKIVGIASGQYIKYDGTTNVSSYNYVLSDFAKDFFKKAKREGMYDGAVVDVVPTPPPQKPIDTEFNFYLEGSEGIFSIRFATLPKTAYKLSLYWNGGLAPFEVITLQNTRDFETMDSYGLGINPKVTVKVFDKTNQLLVTKTK